MSASPLRPAIFLDRDGTLMEEVDYCRDPDRVRLLPGVTAGLKRLLKAGFALVIVTNQSGIGRGWIRLSEYEAVQARLLQLLGPGLIEATYFCPETPDQATTRRKPEPGMVLEAARDLHLDLPRSWLIGDKMSDVHCARRAGVRPILVRTGYGASQPFDASTLTALGMAEAADLILRDSAG